MGVQVYICISVCVGGLLPMCENVDFCVYMSVCKCDCMCVSMIACVGVRVRAHLCMSMHVCMHVSMCVSHLIRDSPAGQGIRIILHVSPRCN